MTTETFLVENLHWIDKNNHPFRTSIRCAGASLGAYCYEFYVSTTLFLPGCKVLWSKRLKSDVMTLWRYKWKNLSIFFNQSSRFLSLRNQICKPRYYRLLPGPSRRQAPVIKCNAFLCFQSYIVRDILLTERYRWLVTFIEILSAIFKSTSGGVKRKIIAFWTTRFPAFTM